MTGGLDALFHRSPVALVAVVGLVFLALSVLVALRPALSLRETSHAATGAAPAADPGVERGRLVYLREGCGYCHSQLVRPTLIDRPYGRA